MIETLTDLPDGVIGFRAVGAVTEDDYRRVVMPAVRAAAAAGGIRLVYVLDGAFERFTAGAMVSDAKVGVGEWSAWERIALVTDHRWLHDGVQAFAWVMPGEVKVFALGEIEEAKVWAAG